VWAPGPVLTRTEHLVFTGILFPDRPARSKSLHRLYHPGPHDDVNDDDDDNNNSTIIIIIKPEK